MAKHAVPKKKASTTQTNRRYKAFQNNAQKRLLNKGKSLTCAKCASAVLQHHLCTACGFYREKDILGKSKSEKVTTIKA